MCPLMRKVAGTTLKANFSSFQKRTNQKQIFYSDKFNVCYLFLLILVPLAKSCDATFIQTHFSPLTAEQVIFQYYNNIEDCPDFVKTAD